ncbi:hypothetical protein Sme01_42920 [Sphaerisporangium melleum]|uniref:DUF2092 domain-containing protein n=1 Tax=Sphaerisporangium melleum TaxID=321316 RepID=A0A917QZG0_9ACTN|nr:hypothetical protein [Sphaerisporangium melleum]GGK77145.1 hypothetical protein GCM10007964_19880 [Sphaerisporangium melleum]GII71816.1 hypothetical protein Sme01_42920 [Sphaerisporangium melleum]
MTRLLALAATAAVAPALALAVPAAAHSGPQATMTATRTPQKAPANPVEALRAQLAKKTSVHLDETTRLTVDREEFSRYRQVGTLRLGTSGVEAYDTKTKVADILFGTPTSSIRVVAVGGKTYLKSPLYDAMLPAGRTWVRTSDAIPYTNMVDILQPKVLRTTLAGTKHKGRGGMVGGARTTLLTGTVPLSALAKVSPGLAPLAKSIKSGKPLVLPWKLWVGADQLPRRFQVTLELPSESKYQAAIGVDSRYTAWGGKAVITAPPATLVVDEEDLTSDLPEVTPDYTTKVGSLAAREH